MKINGVVMYPSHSDSWNSHLECELKNGSLWYQPNSKSSAFPDSRGRLLEFCETENGLDFCEVPIVFIENEVTVVDYWWNKLENATKEEKVAIIKKLSHFILEDLIIQKFL